MLFHVADEVEVHLPVLRVLRVEDILPVPAFPVAVDAGYHRAVEDEVGIGDVVEDVPERHPVPFGERPYGRPDAVVSAFVALVMFTPVRKAVSAKKSDTCISRIIKVMA